MYLPTRLPETETRATDDPVALTLLRAAQVIREKGWCQNALEDERGRVCAFHAIILADVRHAGPAVSRLNAHLGDLVQYGIPGWNNASGRTADEVISALESAALSRATAIRGV